MKGYINFHAHSTGSLLDGLSKFDEYAEKAKADGSVGMCFTEHGNLFSLLKAYEAAKEVGLKYFPGCEFYHARKTRFDRDEEEKSGKESEEWQQRGPYHLGIVAVNNAGYHNLLRLSSKAYLEGWYGKPRIDRELLSQHSEGLVVLSGCLSGEIQQAFLRDDFAHATRAAAEMQEIVGKDNFFIEMQDHDIPEEQRNHPHLQELARALNAPIIATCDSHYTLKEHAHAHDVMLCTNTGSRIDTPGRFKFNGDHFHLKSYDEMATLFPELWLDNTLLIAEKHDFSLSFDEYYLPKFSTPDGMDTVEYFITDIKKGARKRYGDNWESNSELVDRINYEVEVICEMGFADYFLIVSDIVRWAKGKGIMVGPGRGSAAGSIVSYCLDITEVDPIKHGLPFERFLIRGRKSMPDIDIDFDSRYRDDCMTYAREKYGYDFTASICTFSKIGPKTAVKDTARVLNYPFDVGQKINNTMPPPLFGKEKTFEECLQSNEFRQLYESDPDVKSIVDTARTFEGLWRQTGVHAAGLVISDKPITEHIPLMQKGEDKPITTQWDMGQVDKLGLLKMDFLSLRNLDIIDLCVENIKQSKGYDIGNVYNLPDEEDPKVFQALSNGDNIGVFQMEGSGMRNLMTNMKPNQFSDLAAILALYRPGPMASGVHFEYCDRKNGRKQVTYPHPSLEPYLNETYGLLLYQEQLLNIARFVAGFSVLDSDKLRKAVGKKLPEEMKKWREQFVQGCIDVGKMPKHLAIDLWNEIEHHADYSFSKNHSVPYGSLSYITAYLHIYYPTEYMAAALSSLKGTKADQVRQRLYLSDCKKMGINVLPPSIVDSSSLFNVSNADTIRFGFKSVKGVGTELVSIIDNDHQKYNNLWDFLRKADKSYLDRGTMQSFVYAGVLDDFLTDMDIPQEPLNRQEKMGMLHEELMTLGVFLTHHPFSDAADLVAGKTSHSIRELQEMPAGERVRVAGMVLECKQKITRQGKRMYDLVIEDTELNIDVAIMPNIAAKLPENPYVPGDVIIVTGKVKKEGEDDTPITSLYFWEGEKISDAALTGESPIILKVDKYIPYEKINRLNDIIEAAKGNVPVYLQFNDGNGEARMRFTALTSRDVESTLRKLIEV